jgi:hypothetical protein
MDVMLRADKVPVFLGSVAGWTLKAKEVGLVG